MNDQPLVEALKGCSLHSLLMITSKALTRSGFGDVQILDRRHTKQKSRFGGHELLCQTAVGCLPMRIIVKVINDAGRVRMLDELAGSVIRTKADLGLLMTPHHLSANANRVQGSYFGVRIETITGSALAAFVRSHGIGVRPSGELDYAFFSELEEVSGRLLSFLEKERL